MKVITEPLKDFSRLIIPVEIINPETGKSECFRAMWDTGANVSLISRNAAKKLELPILEGVAHITYLNHAEQMPVCNAQMLICRDLMASMPFVVWDGSLQYEHDVIIGMDIIGQGDFHVRNEGGNFRVTFSVEQPSRKREELFVCQCNDVSHQLVLSTCEDEPVVYGMFHLDNYGLGSRIANAAKYILGIQRKDGDFDALLFKNEDADRLQWFVDALDGGQSVDLPEFEPVVTTKTEQGREWKDTEYYRWTFDSKDNTYQVTATTRECLSSPELNHDIDMNIDICVWMKAAPFYKRIVRGIKHIFGYRSRFGDFDSFEFSPTAAPHLRKLTMLAKQK